MYKRKEAGKGGSYYPAFLCMEVNTPEDLYYLCRYPLDERTEAVFLHEYIHYLQDLTTVSGLARIETIIDQIKWVHGVAMSHNKIKVPMDLNTWAYNIKPNAHSLSISKGDFKVHDDKGHEIAADIISIVSFELIDTTIFYSSGNKYHGKAVAQLIFNDQHDIERKYNVGEMAISESMAYLIENHVYPNVLQKPSACPYFVVKKIAEWKMRRTIDDITLIAICDVCLLYALPGKALYDILEKLQYCKTPINPAAVYMYGLGAEMADKFSRKKFWTDELATTIDTAKKQFSDLFVHPYWNDFRMITNQVFDSALTLRIQNPRFFLEIAKGGCLPINKQINDCINKLGCLAIKTSTDAVYNFLPLETNALNLDSDWFLSLHQLYNILFTNVAIGRDNAGKRILGMECKLKQWCRDSFRRKNELDITSSSPNCSWSPWLNVSHKDLEQCSFGRIWAAFGFGRIKLK